MKRLLPLVALLVSPAVAFAQVDRAAVTGTVRDASGAVLAEATVSATSASGVSLRVRATGEGTYLLPNLPPGAYAIQAEAPGFAAQSRAVVLSVAQRARLDFLLPVGGVAEEVTVEQATTLLNNETAAFGSVIDQGAVANLPLAIRNWDDLLALVAGVQGDRFTEEGGGTSFGRTGGVNVHGNRSLQNNFLLDGVDNNSISTYVT